MRRTVNSLLEILSLQLYYSRGISLEMAPKNNQEDLIIRKLNLCALNYLKGHLEPLLGAIIRNECASYRVVYLVA
jgi:hypothetical protein